MIFFTSRIPAAELRPDIILLKNEPSESEPFNCADWLLKRALAAGRGDEPAVLADGVEWSYRQLTSMACRIAHMLRDDYLIAPGERILLRSGNNPMLEAAWLGVVLAGGVAVTTMPLLRDVELAKMIAISEPALALCETGRVEDLQLAAAELPIICFDGDGGGELGLECIAKSDQFPIITTKKHDPVLIGFTSGTTGQPKAALHCQRDIFAICEVVAGAFLDCKPDDIFIGTAPLAFTFGLGGLLLFPLYCGGAVVLNGRYQPEELVAAIGRFQVSVLFTVPTFYRRMAAVGDIADMPPLRLAVSSGEALAAQVRQDWDALGKGRMSEVLGATEMLHAFAGSHPADMRQGAIGKAFAGYELAILDADGNRLAANVEGRLAVRGPTGCHYLNDPRQTEYVQNGWNITGDICRLDEDGYLYYAARGDDMIITAGYNVGAVEVEDALLSHAMVAECAVTGEPDQERGQIICAYVVPVAVIEDEDQLTQDLQDHVKQRIAAYKYPRKIVYCSDLPRNESGKLQRFRLRPC